MEAWSRAGAGLAGAAGSGAAGALAWVLMLVIVSRFARMADRTTAATTKTKTWYKAAATTATATRAAAAEEAARRGLAAVASLAATAALVGIAEALKVAHETLSRGEPVLVHVLGINFWLGLLVSAVALAAHAANVLFVERKWVSLPRLAGLGIEVGAGALLWWQVSRLLRPSEGAPAKVRLSVFADEAVLLRDEEDDIAIDTETLIRMAMRSEAVMSELVQAALLGVGLVVLPLLRPRCAPRSALPQMPAATQATAPKESLNVTAVEAAEAARTAAVAAAAAVAATSAAAAAVASVHNKGQTILRDELIDEDEELEGKKESSMAGAHQVGDLLDIAALRANLAVKEISPFAAPRSRSPRKNWTVGQDDALAGTPAKPTAICTVDEATPEPRERTRAPSTGSADSKKVSSSGLLEESAGRTLTQACTLPPVPVPAGLFTPVQQISSGRARGDPQTTRPHRVTQSPKPLRRVAPGSAPPHRRPPGSNLNAKGSADSGRELAFEATLCAAGVVGLSLLISSAQKLKR